MSGYQILTANWFIHTNSNIKHKNQQDPIQTFHHRNKQKVLHFESGFRNTIKQK